MNPLWLASVGLIRQPARAALGVLGVAAVGALLLDMLLLSRGLVVSMADLLERTGWDVRVTNTDDLPGRAPRIARAGEAIRLIAGLPSVKMALPVRFADARLERRDTECEDPSSPACAPLFAEFQGVGSSGRFPWTILRGRDPNGPTEIVVNETAAAALETEPGAELVVRASCAGDNDAPPPVVLRVAGIANFPFEVAREHMLAGTLEALGAACGAPIDEVDLILVTSTGDPARAADAIRTARADLRAGTNAEMLGRIEQNGFTYFRQISAVLSTVTLFFAALLIAVLLTVSVNQRLGQIAALRALGFPRRRVVADILTESALIVGTGGLLSIPLGLVLARVLDDILKTMPGIPVELHFFVFQPRALAVHLLLLGAAAVAAALYPMHIVARLPIAATLRDETV